MDLTHNMNTCRLAHTTNMKTLVVPDHYFLIIYIQTLAPGEARTQLGSHSLLSSPREGETRLLPPLQPLSLHPAAEFLHQPAL